MYSCKVCAYRDEKFYQSCPVCGATNSFIDEDMDILQQLHCSQQLIDTMQKLRKTDIIEYELKMSQFRNQLEQKRVNERAQYQQQTQNSPKCPTCQSTNIKKISATSKATNAILFGLFGNKRNKQFHCNSCGYEW